MMKIQLALSCACCCLCLGATTAEPIPVSILAEPTWIPNTSAAVYTNGVLSAETEEGSGQWHAWSNETATVVYTADDEFAFYDGSTVKTNALDTTQDPAVNAEFPGLTEPFMSPADAQAELGVEYGRNQRDICNVAHRTADEKVVAARQLEQVYADAREAVDEASEARVASTCRNGAAQMRKVVYELARSVHSEFRPITNYFHEVTFTDYSPCFVDDVLGDFRNPILPNLEDLLPDFRTFGCSGCVKDGLVGRNFDWTFGITDEYLVRTERNERHYASIGISAPGALLAMEKVGLVDLSGGNYTNAIPYTTVDGVNEFGVHVSAYVVPGKDVGFTTNTNPQATETIPQIAFVRYALDRAASFADVTNLAATANIYSSLTFELHFFVTDGKDSCVIEFVDNKVVFVADQTKITNYYLSQRLKDPAKPYTPNSMGIERYQDLERMLPNVTDKASMLVLMTNLNYSTTYTGDPKSRWSELNGFENEEWSVTRSLLTPRSFYHGDTNDFDEAEADRTKTFARLKEAHHTDWTNYLATGQLGKDPKIWVTSHAAVYDLANRSIDMHFLEGRETYSFRLSDAWNIGATATDTVTAWTNATGVLFIDGTGKMRDFGPDGTGLPWSPDSITAVVISDGVTSIGANAWYGLADSATYNGLNSAAARTLIEGFGGSLGYARTPFKDIQVGGGTVQLAVALETTPSLTNEWTEVKLKADSVDVDSDGHIIIQHQTENQDQGYYILQSVK